MTSKTEVSIKNPTQIIARGGSGGRGNAFIHETSLQLSKDGFSSTNPGKFRIAERGAVGEVSHLYLRINKFADLGLIGAPNVGKSTILRAITRARPKVAPYPFTTLKPNVGMMPLHGEMEAHENKSLAIADLPGIIEGSSLGHGLGAEFLSFIEGCRLFAIVIDLSLDMDVYSLDERIRRQIEMIMDEIEDYDSTLLEELRSYILIGTKLDLISDSSNIKQVKEKSEMMILEIFNTKGYNLSPKNVAVVSADKNLFLE